MEITSVNNEKIKYVQKLKEKKYRDIEKLFLIEDEHLLSEALKKGFVKEIYTVDTNLSFNVPTYYISSKIMKKLTDQVTGTKVIAVCHQLKEREIKGNILILDRLQDPGNLGTIIRSSVAFNFDSIFLSSDSVDLYNPKVIRASEGMFFHLNIVRGNIEEFIKNLDKEYLKVTTNVQNGENIKNLKYNKIAIIIGNEGQGVRPNISALCDKMVKIPMTFYCESLNAGVSASILMYEVYNG